MSDDYRAGYERPTHDYVQGADMEAERKRIERERERAGERKLYVWRRSDGMVGYTVDPPHPTLDDVLREMDVAGVYEVLLETTDENEAYQCYQRALKKEGKR